MLNSGQKSSSNFAQKCSLLSQYLKENGSFGDISLGMTTKLQSRDLETSRQQQQAAATTMNLLPILENSAEDYSTQNVGESTNDKTKSSTFGSSSQMTIFYDGKLLVFNDFPAEKAQEIMALVGRFESSNSTSNTFPAGFGSTSAAALEKVDSRKTAFATPDLNIASCTSNGSCCSNMNAGQKVLLHPHHQPRRASLHRFFEKRKDRITARSPYQVNSNRPSSMTTAAPPPPTPESSKPWFDLEVQSSKQLELKL